MFISKEDVNILISEGNAENIAVYFCSVAIGSRDAEEVARVCKLPLEQINQAISSLASRGLLPEKRISAPADEAARSCISFDDADDMICQDPELNAVCTRLADMKTMPLSREEKVEICRLYSLGWDCETLLILMDCIQEANPKSFYMVGEIVSAAKDWEARGIRSPESARTYCAQQHIRSAKFTQWKGILSSVLNDRQLQSVRVVALLNHIYDLGTAISDRDIRTACEKTKNNTRPGMNRVGYLQKVITGIAESNKVKPNWNIDPENLPVVTMPRKTGADGLPEVRRPKSLSDKGRNM